MKKLRHILFYLLLLPNTLIAQTIPTFIKTHGGSTTTTNGEALVQTKDGRFYIVSSIGNFDVLVLKLNAYGDSIGYFSIGTPEIDNGYDMILDDDTTLMIVGTTTITNPSYETPTL
ncbi:MAG: hypothetical protein IPN54_02405 [Bacteroidetes bacterium]|nr:hypothetical protein [Bacteroidota bacterium]